MKKTELFNSVSRAVHKVGFKLKKHSPEILLVTGIVGGVTSAVMACKATTKVGAILEETKEKVDQLRDFAQNDELKQKYLEKYGEEFTEQDHKKELTVVYAKAGLEFVKLYGPSIALGALSIGCICTSHNIVNKRYLASAAAYTAVDNAFKDYRKNVVDRFGKELDKELKYNIKSKEIEEKIVNEDGSETVEKKTVQVANPGYISEFTLCFDETCSAWSRDAELNKATLVQTQNWANDVLRSQGHLFLNEVLDMLGAQRTRAGNVVGWVYNSNDPEYDGDGYVDFGMIDLYDENKRNFANGLEKSIWLEFNVDGNVLDLLK